jgi:hypothetical protein
MQQPRSGLVKLGLSQQTQHKAHWQIVAVLRVMERQLPHQVVWLRILSAM